MKQAGLRGKDQALSRENPPKPSRASVLDEIKLSVWQRAVSNYGNTFLIRSSALHLLYSQQSISTS